MKKYFAEIRRCSLFDDIEDDKLFTMLNCLGATIQHYSKNQTIMEEGRPAKNIGILLNGSIQLVQNDYYGNRSIIASVEPSHLFGESFACVDKVVLPMNIVACDDTDAMLIDCRRMLKSCSNACSFHTQLIYNLMKIVAAKNIMFNQKMAITSKRSTKEKLIAYLLVEAKKNESESFVIPYDRQELADYLGVERSGLSMEISKLKKAGMIETKKNQFRIHESMLK
ncbi:MAG: Crp/Fnr family transcriptional regulator [Schaedlerella sp.]|nr:Crp/Fnr family transcriptional regulator [Schaedlerella sp.]